MFDYAYKIKPTQHSCSIRALDGMVYGVIAAATKAAAEMQLKEVYGATPTVVGISIDGIIAYDLTILERWAIYHSAVKGKPIFRRAPSGGIDALDPVTLEPTDLGALF